MTTVQPSSHPAPRAELFAGAAAAIRSAMAAIGRKHNARRTRNTLHGLSDHILRDIGVQRTEIDSRFSYVSREHTGNRE